MIRHEPASAGVRYMRQEFTMKMENKYHQKASLENAGLSFSFFLSENKFRERPIEHSIQFAASSGMTFDAHTLAGDINDLCRELSQAVGDFDKTVSLIYEKYGFQKS